MSFDELLTQLRHLQVKLWVEGDALRYRGAEDVLSPELLEQVRQYKSELIRFLRETKNGTESAGSTNFSTSAGLEYRFVGRSGLKSAEFILGPYSSTMIRAGTDEALSRLLDTYLSAGGNHIDVANVYTGVEKRVGKWLQTKNRDQLIISSKAGLQVGQGPNDLGLSRKHIFMSLEKTLRDLGTDYVDIYYAHVWDGGTPLEETLSTLNRLLTSGKVRYLGVSNYTGWQLQKAVDIANLTGKEPISCLQTQYNLLDRYPEWEQIPVCHNEGVGLLAWGSLSAGWLTGRYRRGMSPSKIGDRASFERNLGMDHNSYEFKNNERTWRTIDVLLDVASELDKTPAQVALNWLKDQPGVIPILGPRNVEQLEESLGAAGWSLTAEQRSRLDAASQLAPIMPHMFVRRVNPPDRQ